VVVLNILYNVGARDEQEDKTGFAHLFEHLMFGGSINIPDYDKHVEQAGGSNNAFTNNDYTNYYITVPLENVETAFWLESDRMLQLAFSQNSLDVQKGVVLEEFRQRCFNAPFGKLWHHSRSLLYKSHPYRWPTIGLELAHIEQATLGDVEAFYYKHYHPANAILCVAGNISLEETKRLCEKWFAGIDRKGTVNKNLYPAETEQRERRFLKTKDLSPSPGVFMCWRGPGYMDLKSAGLELFGDVLGGSETSPLYLELVKRSGLMNAAESFCMRSLDDSIFMVYGLLNEGLGLEEGEAALGNLLQETLMGKHMEEKLFQAAKNKLRSQLLFEKTSLMTIAQKLCYFELLGDVQMIHTENETYQKMNYENTLETARALFRKENASVIYYEPND